MSLQIPDLLSRVEVLTSIAGCKTVKALYKGQIVICKELCFRTQVSAEKCLTYYKHAKSELRNCRHVASIIDILPGLNFSTWVVFEYLTDSLESEMARRDSAPWSESELVYLMFPLMSDLALLEAFKINACFLHPGKLFLRNGRCVLSKVSYPVYDRQKAKVSQGFFLSPEFRQMIAKDQKLETVDFLHNNVYCLGMTMCCMLAGLDPEAMQGDLTEMQQRVSAMGLSSRVETMLRCMLSSDVAKQPGFISLFDKQPSTQPKIQLKLGENVITLSGIQTIQELHLLVRNALNGDRYDLLNARKEKIQSQSDFLELAAQASKRGKPIALEVAAHFAIFPEDSI